MVITIGLFWFIGKRNKEKEAVRLEQYTQELLAQQKNLEAVAVKDLKNTEVIKTPIELTPDLVIASSSANQPEQLRAYDLAMVKAFEPLGTNRGNEVTAVLSAIDKNDPTLLKAVTESRINHQAVSANLARVIVPQELVSQHRKLIFQINFIVSLLTNMEKALDEPRSALSSSKGFISAYSTLSKLVSNLNKYLTDKGIKLSPQEQIKIFDSLSQ
ncbi:MAG: hypothetical protein WC537_02455 [Candidatus Paceibacterota bacterium]